MMPLRHHMAVSWATHVGKYGSTREECAFELVVYKQCVVHAKYLRLAPHGCSESVRML